MAWAHARAHKAPYIGCSIEYHRASLMIAHAWPHHVAISNPWLYTFGALAFASLIRVVLSLVRAYKARNTPETLAHRRFWFAYGYYLRGLDPCRTSSRDYGEYFASFLVGFIELLAFPVMFVLGLDTYIGAWIGLKTISIYFRWSGDRVVFNLFLAGNAATVVLSWACLSRFVFLV
jgi:hypothetical protein